MLKFDCVPDNGETVTISSESESIRAFVITTGYKRGPSATISFEGDLPESFFQDLVPSGEGVQSNRESTRSYNKYQCTCTATDGDLFTIELQHLTTFKVETDKYDFGKGSKSFETLAREGKYD